jgi:rSAM/selenodomain-associated transferase 1
MKETLIIFSRYPEPGKTKTRMIPALGANGASNLQRRLSEYTLKQARSLRQLREVDIAVYFAGGNSDLMRNWLGHDVSYYAQAEGDLGVKMQSALADNFANNSERVVIIGIDCPGINNNVLDSAFTALQDNDLVLGEAEDGGYYLIGLRNLYPELFINIKWGTDRVFTTTKNFAESLALSIGVLPVLRDIDRPEDLDLIALIDD